jgi:hypothetical protein
MQFLAPTIGDVFCPIDGKCGACLCPIDYCRIDSNLPKGELIVIVPKTLFVARPNRMIAFAYSPDRYSVEEIDGITRQFLHDLNLRASQANIESLAVNMGIMGYPRVPTNFDRCSCGYDGFISGKNLFIDPDGLTVWNLAITPSSKEEIISISGGWGCPKSLPSDTIIIEFMHPNPEYKGGCAYETMCSAYFDGSIEAPVQIKYFSWIRLFLLILFVLVLYLMVKGVQKIKANKTLE